MVVRHEPRDVVEASIASATGDFSRIDAKVRDLLDESNDCLGTPLSPSTLELLQRAVTVLACAAESGRTITSVQALQRRIAPAAAPQPQPSGIPRRGIGNDTIRDLLGDEVTDVVDVATRLGWTHGDFHNLTAATVFSTFVPAGKDSHALAVRGEVLPLIGMGSGSFDSFVVHQLLELVFGTHHDPTAAFCDDDDIVRISRLWGYDNPAEMPLLDFQKAFAMVIGEEARLRARFARAASAAEVERTFSRDVVVQRLPHAPFDRRLGMPAGELMSREHPHMAATLARYGYRAVLAYCEALREGDLTQELTRLSDLRDLEVRPVRAEELQEFQTARSVTVDVWNVDHYVLAGSDSTGAPQMRIARHARFDDRLTVFDAVGFNDETAHEAVVLAEYATANALRTSCLDASLLTRIMPGLLGANSPHVRAGMRRLAMMGNAAIVASKRREQAT
jgi:hypothetical protein